MLMSKLYSTSFALDSAHLKFERLEQAEESMYLSRSEHLPGVRIIRSNLVMSSNFFLIIVVLKKEDIS